MQQIMHYHTWVTVQEKLKMSSKGMRLTQWCTMSMSALSSFIGLLWSIRYNAMSVQCKELSIRSLDGYKNNYNSTMQPCCSNRSRVFWSFPWWNFVSLVFRTSHTCNYRLRETIRLVSVGMMWYYYVPNPIFIQITFEGRGPIYWQNIIKLITCIDLWQYYWTCPLLFMNTWARDTWSRQYPHNLVPTGAVPWNLSHLINNKLRQHHDCW